MNKGFSYSALSAAFKCNQYYKHLYVDKLKIPGPESIDMHFGTAIHAGLQASLEAADGLKVFELYWSSVKKSEFNQSRFNWDDLLSQGRILIERFNRLHAKKFKIVHEMETRLFGKLHGISIEGTPDFVGEFEGEPAIVDFKTSGYRYHKDRLIVADQLHLYSELATQNFNFNPKQLVYLVLVKGREPSIQILKRIYNADEHYSILNNVHTQALELSTKINFTKNTRNCIVNSTKCEYFDTCWSGK